MAGPTDLLNNDVQELKIDIRDIRSDMGVLKADVHRIDVSLAELRSDVKNAVGIGKWAGSLLVVTLLTGGVTGLTTGIWWASKITDKVQAIDARIDKMEATIAKALDQAKGQASPGPKAN